MAMCRVFSCVIGRGYLLWTVHSLGKILLAFALLHFGLQGQAFLLLWVSLDFLLLHSSLLWWKGQVFLLLVLEGLVSLHRTVQLQPLRTTSWSAYLDYCDIEWFAWESNWDYSFVFEIVPKDFILDSFFLTIRATPFLLRDSAHSSRYNDHLK